MTLGAARPRGFRSARCAGCALTPALCVCSLWAPIQSTLAVSVVMPSSEARSASNSARLLALWLPRATLYLRGAPASAPLSRRDGSAVASTPSSVAPRAAIAGAPGAALAACVRELADPGVLVHHPGSALLFPSERAGRAPPTGIRHLIVPDGTWAQARRVERRWFARADLPRVALADDWASDYGLRRRRTGLCTFEAVAITIGLVEDPSAARALLERFTEWASRARHLKSGALANDRRDSDVRPHPAALQLQARRAALQHGHTRPDAAEPHATGGARSARLTPGAAPHEERDGAAPDEQR